MNINWPRLLLLIGVICLIVVILKDLFMHLRFYYLFQRTIEFVTTKLGHYILINGKIRSGKSSLQSGLAHVLEFHLRGKAMSTMRECRMVLWKLNWKLVHQLIISMFEDDASIIEIQDAVNDLLAEHLQGHVYDNHIRVASYEALMNRYVVAFVRMADNNFTMSKFDYVSRISGLKARQFFPEYISIKNVYQNKKYSLEQYLVIVDDEKGFDDRDSHSHARLAKDADGTIDWFRLIGQLYQENLYYITNLQSVVELNAKDRRLATSIPDTSGVRVAGGFPFFIACIRLSMDFVEKLEESYSKIRYRDPLVRENYLLNPNRFKSIIFRLLNAKNKLFSKYYLIYDSRFYDFADDVGKRNTEASQYYDQFNCVFPLRWCWGTYDTHEMKFIHEVLLRSSSISLKDVEDFTSESSRNEYEKKTSEKVLVRREERSDSSDDEEHIATYQ